MMPIRLAKENQPQRTTREDALIGRADFSSIAYHRKCLLSTYGCHRVDNELHEKAFRQRRQLIRPRQ